jgi:hypothetical protein
MLTSERLISLIATLDRPSGKTVADHQYDPLEQRIPSLIRTTEARKSKLALTETGLVDSLLLEKIRNE